MGQVGFFHSHNTLTMGSEIKCGQNIRGLTKLRHTIPSIGLYAATIYIFLGKILHHQPSFLTLTGAMKMLHFFVDKLLAMTDSSCHSMKYHG